MKRSSCWRSVERAYLYAALGFFALRTIWQGAFPQTPLLPPLALLSVFTPFLLLPLLFILLMNLIRRRWPRPAALLLTLVFVSLYAPYAWLYRPLPVTPVATSQRWVVMSYNVGLGLTPPEEMLATIRREAADVVVVQDLLPTQIAWLRRDLPEYPYQLLADDAESGVLSRYPLRESRWLHAWRGQYRSLSVRIERDGAHVTLFALHPPPPGIVHWGDTPIPVGITDAETQRQVRDAGAQMAALTGPRLLAGDLNLSDQTAAYSALTRTFHDAYREAGQGFGFSFPQHTEVQGIPIPGPFVRLDYLFHSDEWYVEQITLHCGVTSSDHCYWVTQLWLTQTGASTAENGGSSRK